MYLSSHTNLDVQLLPFACILLYITVLAIISLSMYCSSLCALLICLLCRPAHVAHITFREASSVQKVLAFDGKALPQASFPTDEVIGLERWVQEHGVMNNVTATHLAAARASLIFYLLLHIVGGFSPQLIP